MNKDYNLLKKYYGEKFAQLCRDLFPTLLEQEGLLSNIILSKFAPNHHLYDDIVKESIINLWQGYEEEFKNYIYSLIDVEKKEIKINKSVKELLSDAGYNFYECKTEEDIQSFKKYYAKGEELCTFKGGRLDKCYVFFAVKKDAKRIKRSPNPKREDPYGTSVISIQFTKQGHTLSIKNRYNHHVNNPDATFSNNLENIISGLTNAFEKEYGFKINQNDDSKFQLPNYVLADDGKWYKYNYEINNIYYCPDNIIIDNGQVKKYDKSRYLIMEYFIIDMKEKTIKLYDKNIGDCFPDSFRNIEKINILKTKEGKNIVIQATGKEEVIITIDDLNIIVSIDDKNTEIIKDNYLHYTDLSNINLPKLKKVGDYFMDYNRKVTELSFPKLQVVGNNFFCNNKVIEEIELPNLEKVGDYFMDENQSLKELSLPNLKKAGGSFFGHNFSIKDLYLPQLEEVTISFFYRNNKIKTLNLPSLKKAEFGFLLSNEKIQELSLPNLEIAGECFLKYNQGLTKLNLPKLKEAYWDFIEKNKIIFEINLPNLEEVGEFFMANNQNLTKLNLPKLKVVRVGFLEKNMVLKEINLPSLEKHRFFHIDNKRILSIIEQQKLNNSLKKQKK